jgi:hypothetical protein
VGSGVITATGTFLPSAPLPLSLSPSVLETFTLLQWARLPDERAVLSVHRTVSETPPESRLKEGLTAADKSS